MTIPGIPGRLAALILVLPWALAPAVAQEPPPTGAPEMAGFCAGVPECRRELHTPVRMADGQQMTEHLPVHRPAILPGSLSVMLGEQVEAVPEFGRGGQFRKWREARRRDSTRNLIIRFQLRQDNDGSIAAQIDNETGDPVKLRLFVRHLGSGEETYISSCPVAANGSIFEYWAEPVVELLVRDISLVSDDAALLCD